ncbi:DUF1173 family protein [Nocardia sp. NPDC052001]|uniref:DUF1173 family protein n=1 Tax=Nocardia sp. NPDC052001 TaxID=3154853 RepID=UPI00344A2761
MGRADLVRVAGHRIRLDAMRAHPERYGRLAATAKTIDGHAYCLCRPEPLRLVIRHRLDRYFLARWPGEGPLHDPSCPFHQPDPALTGRAAYADTAIVDTPTGTTIRFDAPLTSSTAASVSGAQDELGATTSGSGRRTVGLLGLLHYLWEDARLNTWNPGKRRDWGTIAADIGDRIHDCALSGRPLHQVLHVIPPDRPGTRVANLAAFDEFVDRLRGPRDQIRRALVLGELTAVTATRYGVAYTLAHCPKRLFASAPLHERVLRSYGSAFSRAASTHAGRRVGLFLIERSPKGYATVADTAIMLTTGTGYIPCDSSHELVMADALRHADRAFLKPVRYDHVSLVLPDFVLTDTDIATVIEVWGLDSEEYLRRKAIKIAEYERSGTQLIGWCPEDPLPNLAVSTTPFSDSRKSHGP